LLVVVTKSPGEGRQQIEDPVPRTGAAIRGRFSTAVELRVRVSQDCVLCIGSLNPAEHLLRFQNQRLYGAPGTRRACRAATQLIQYRDNTSRR